MKTHNCLKCRFSQKLPNNDNFLQCKHPDTEEILFNDALVGDFKFNTEVPVFSSKDLTVYTNNSNHWPRCFFNGDIKSCTGFSKITPS